VSRVAIITSIVFGGVIFGIGKAFEPTLPLYSLPVCMLGVALGYYVRSKIDKRR